MIVRGQGVRAGKLCFSSFTPYKNDAMTEKLLLVLAVASCAAVPAAFLAASVPESREETAASRSPRERAAIARRLYGKIRVVGIGEDYKVRSVGIGEDLRVRVVDLGANSPGLWEFVDIGEDYKVRFVDIGEDITVRFVGIGEGPR